MRPVRLLVIGAGSRGTTYSNYVLEHPDEAVVVGVAEPRTYYRDRLAEAHDLAAERVFSDWREALDIPRFADAIIIATPDQEHVQPAVAAAGRGYHILLEKPMATTPEGCEQIVTAVENAGVLFALCHVLRYTPYTQKVKAIVDSGRIGDVVTIQRLEPIGFWHFAHSYVRGNWRNANESCCMLLAKSCHDLDWMTYVLGERCSAVSSFGALHHFQKANKPARAQEALRCVDCDFEPQCVYSARSIYLRLAESGHTGWPLDVVTERPSPESIAKAIQTGPYGRCVYECDNDVVDHQVVSMQFAGGQTATFTATAFTELALRHTWVSGTHGRIRGDGGSLEVFDFADRRTERVDLGGILGGLTRRHGGGDDEMMRRFVEAVATDSSTPILSGPRDSLHAHHIVFAAETARLEGRVVTL